MMLDLPELLAPARIVSGAISISCLLTMDLKPSTAMRVIPSAMVLAYPNRFSAARSSSSVIAPGWYSRTMPWRSISTSVGVVLAP